jgi:hypothetical protein
MRNQNGREADGRGSNVEKALKKEKGWQWEVSLCGKDFCLVVGILILGLSICV